MKAKSKHLAKATLMLGLIGLTACGNSGDAILSQGQLRDPEKFPHTHNAMEFINKDYLSFKNKLLSFSTELSEAILKREDSAESNLAFSPFSISLCLGLAICASSGTTRAELLSPFGMEFETFNAYYGTYFDEMNFVRENDSKEVTQSILPTNSIWINAESKLLDEGLDALADGYRCYSYKADFKNRNKEANDAVKRFINERTKGLLNPDLGLSPDTLFVLMNTLYLKDIWNDMGNELREADPDYAFVNHDGSKSDKKLYQSYYCPGRALDGDGFKSFKADTAHGLSLHFLLPDSGVQLKDILTSENLDYVLDSSNYVYKDDEKKEIYHTKCVFPEFVGESDIDLKPVLSEDFGIKSFFVPTYDFSSLFKEDAVFCSKARHIAKLETTKRGIEGAAVTYFAMEATSAWGGENDYKDVYETFPVESEFGYLLSYRGTLLFSGTVHSID